MTARDRGEVNPKNRELVCLMASHIVGHLAADTADWGESEAAAETAVEIASRIVTDVDHRAKGWAEANRKRTGPKK